MELEDIIPAEAEFTVEKTGKTYAIRKIGVKDHGWLIQKHGGEAGAKDIFKLKKMKAVAQFVYYLLPQEDRADFLSKEIERISDDGEKEKIKLSGPEVLLDSLTEDETSRMVQALTRAMINGNPIIEPAVIEAMEAEKKRLGISPPPRPDWGRIFDTISSEYGYTPHEFGTLSIRDIDFMLRKISERKGEEYKLQAAFHGIKIELPASEGDEKTVTLSEDDETMAMRSINETLARKQREAAQNV